MLLPEFLKQSILAIRGASFAGHVGGVHDFAFKFTHGLSAAIAKQCSEIIERRGGHGEGVLSFCGCSLL